MRGKQSVGKVEEGEVKKSGGEEKSAEEEENKEVQMEGGEKEEREERVGGGGEELDTTPMRWVKKSTLANLLAEEVSDSQVSCVAPGHHASVLPWLPHHPPPPQYEEVTQRLTQLAEHPQAHLVAEFLDQYRRPVYAYRRMANLPKVS